MAHVAVTVEGGLFAADLLERLATTPERVPGQRPADFGIDGTRLSDEIQAAFSDARRQWETFQSRRARPHTSLTTLTRDLWVIPLLTCLGYDALPYQRAAAQVGGNAYAISHRAGDDPEAPPVHAVTLDRRLDARETDRQSPHALVQDYLNRSDALWGVVTNGERLRLLRDSARVAKPTYVEFDLRAMVEGNLYSEFVLLYRLAHRTRLPTGTADAHACWLERYYQQGIEEGGRVREHLRDGVEEALKVFGTAVLAHPASGALRHRIGAGLLDDVGYYRQLLRLVYRLLFLMVAEERKLLLVPSHANASRQAIYTNWYSVARLRERAERRFTADPHGDLWEGLKQTFRLFRDDRTAGELGLTALDGELFGPLGCPDLEGAGCGNDDLLRAIFHLSTFEDREGRRGRGVRRRVNYAHLDVEELGSVYESLLDYHPHVALDPPGFDLVAGGERKRTGSYYTPPELVRELIESALVPVMEERLEGARRVADGEWRTEEEVREARAVLSGLGDLATGDGAGRGGVSAHGLLPEGGDVRPDLADSPGGGLDTGEHRRGLGPGGQPGVPAVPSDRAGQPARAGDPPPAESTSRLLPSNAAQPDPRHHVDSRQADPDPSAAPADRASLLARWRTIPLTTRYSQLAERALLALKVCDPASGSGHFLLAAARRIGRELTRVRTGEPEPAPEAYRAAVRDVVRRCLYAVDRNPLAVDLCKVALWIEGHNAGRPLSFLDHRVRCGDSLVGVFDLNVLERGIPDEAYKHKPLTGDDKEVARDLRRRNAKEREGQQTLELFGSADLSVATRHVVEAVAGLDEVEDDSPQQVAEKERRYHELRELHADFRRLRQACDLWTAAFFVKLEKPAPGQPERIPTTDHVLRALRNQPGTQAAWKTALELADEHRFFHWPLEFPEVFSKGGFDVVLGNPPWDTLSPDTKEFFAPFNRDVRFASLEEQEAIVTGLLERPQIATAWKAYCDALYLSVHFMKASGRYRLFAPGNLGKGDFNVYRMFVELALMATRPGRQTSQIVPENFYNGANAAAIRAYVFDKATLEKLLCFENRREVWFKKVDSRAKFALYIARKGGHTDHFSAAFGITSKERLEAARHERPLDVPLEIIREFSPDALAIMEFVNQYEIDIARKMYARFPRFGERIEGAPLRYYMREVDMGTNRKLFEEDPSGLPVYEGRMVAAFDYRAKGYMSGRGRKADWEDLPFGDSRKAIRPQWYIPVDRLPSKLGRRPFDYRIGFCDVTSPTNERSLVAAMIPPQAVAGHKVPTISFTNVSSIYYSMIWLGIVNALVMDFIVRRKVALTMSYTIIDTLPFWRTATRDSTVDQIAWRALALSCAGPEMEALWQHCHSEPWVPAGLEPVGDPDARARLQAEIDALVAYLYGLSRDELRYVVYPSDVVGAESGIENFKRLRLNEENQFKEYRTRRLVYEAFDRFAQDGTFAPERLEDTVYFDTVRGALRASKDQLAELERTLRELVVRSDATPFPSLFVEGETDARIFRAAWSVFFPGERMPFDVLPANGTKQMKSLAAPGKAMRDVIKDRLVCALADNAGEGRRLWEEGKLHRGGVWLQQTNGVHWCLLKPTHDFVRAMERFEIPKAIWPFTIENAFAPALRREALAEDAYGLSDDPQSDLVDNRDVARRLYKVLRGIDEGDDATFYLMAPHPEAKESFAEWVTRPERLTRENYAAFEGVLAGLRELIGKHAGREGGDRERRHTA